MKSIVAKVDANPAYGERFPRVFIENFTKTFYRYLMLAFIINVNFCKSVYRAPFALRRLFAFLSEQIVNAMEEMFVFRICRLTQTQTRRIIFYDV